MAIHTQLPVYKLAYDLLGLATDVTRNMSRDFKQSLGDKIRVECVEMLVLIGRANAAQHKAPFLTTLLEHLEVAQLLLRLAHDKRLVSHDLFGRAIEVSEGIGKQVGGWRKQSLAASPAA